MEGRENHCTSLCEKCWDMGLTLTAGNNISFYNGKRAILQFSLKMHDSSIIVGKDGKDRKGGVV